MNRKANPWVALVALMLLVTILVCVCAGCGGGFRQPAPARVED